MVFKNFRVQVVVRIMILTLAICALAYCLMHEFYLRSVYAAIAVLVVVTEFAWYVDRFNRDVRSFLISLKQRDFTTRFPATGRSKSFDELYSIMNEISSVFRTISGEKEAQYRYLEMLVEHLRVGILTVDDQGKIQLANQALKDLLRKEVLFSLKSLEAVDVSLVDTLRAIRSGETRLLKFRVQNEMLHLSIHASEFWLENRYHKLISMQNIRNELDAREMEAWQKLIRVLTHEIMNSVSPVISLSETLQKLTDKHRKQLAGYQELYTPLIKGLEAIRVRSEGLYHFTQSYRKLTAIPRLSIKKSGTREIIDRVMVLLAQELKERGISVKSSSADLPLVVDPELMEHVLINLLLNAMQAVEETVEPFIEVSAGRNAEGRVWITIRDNGEGIDDATAEKIFIPFFTTRKNGSGIGLALTKQILQLHQADIHFTSEKGKGTEFVIVL